MAVVLEKDNAVDAWRELLGPFELDVARIEAPDRSVSPAHSGGATPRPGRSHALPLRK